MHTAYSSGNNEDEKEERGLIFSRSILLGMKARLLYMLLSLEYLIRGVSSQILHYQLLTTAYYLFTMVCKSENPIYINSGRGVWESNPPGAAPSDPPAVLKTVRPTGAPTPPYIHVAWPYWAIDVLGCQVTLRIRSTSTSVSDLTTRSAVRQPGRRR